MKRNIVILFIVSGLILIMISCTSKTAQEESSFMKFQLHSPAFAEGAKIPDLYSYTPKGENLSPPLIWQGAPQETKSYALICEDYYLSFYHFTHWLMFNIPAGTANLPEGIPNGGILSDNIIQGKNGYKKNIYVGPHPMIGNKHVYHFKMYALDTILEPNVNMTKKELMKKIKNHIIGTAELTGYYTKKDKL